MARGKHSADRDYFVEQKVNSYYENKRENKEEVQEANNQFSDNSYYEEYDDEPRVSKIKIICCIVIVLVIVGIAFFVSRNKKETIENVVEENTVNLNQLASTYENYLVLGKIKIDSIGVEQYILDSKEEEALKHGVVKLYGSSLNNYDNLCLAGHNFENIFGKLNELDKGDTIILVDKDLSETEYIVKEILSVDPTDLTVLLPREETVELTLITCESASTERLVIKAEEKSENVAEKNTEEIVEEETDEG